MKSIQLENGQMLTIYDASKKIAGDRWQVNTGGPDDLFLLMNVFLDANDANIRRFPK